jgi:CubicO group peptidase (beta-lactamase class C family)
VTGRRAFLRDGSGALLAAAVGHGRHAPECSGWRDLDDDTASQIPDVMRVAPAPGLMLAVVSNGVVRSPRAYGVVQAGTDRKVSGDTAFEAGSLGKPVFASAVLSLRDEGRIDLDRPLVSYLRLPDLTDPRADAITARHVLSHSSGLGNWRVSPSDQLTLGSAPGQRFAYSGEGYAYLQRVVEHITGIGIADFMRQRVFERLGMPHSTYVWTPAIGATLATGHRATGAPHLDGGQAYWGPRWWALAERSGKPFGSWTYDDAARGLAELRPNVPIVPNFVMPNVAGTLFTTAGDYARFLAAMLDQSQLSAIGMSERSHRDMMSRQVSISAGLGWGLGWGLERETERDFIWHWGDMGDFTGFMVAEPSMKTGVVLFTNAARGLDVCRWVVARLTGSDHRAFAFVSNPTLSTA